LSFHLAQPRTAIAIFRAEIPLIPNTLVSGQKKAESSGFGRVKQLAITIPATAALHSTAEIRLVN